MEGIEDIQPQDIKRGQLVHFLGGIERAMLVNRIGLIVALIVVAGLLWNNHTLTGQIVEMANKRPVMVVPGATAGVYTPGLTSENLINVARYLVGLQSDFTDRNIAAREQEFESYFSPLHLSGFHEKALTLIQNVRNRAESRVFVPDPNGDKLTRAADGSYEYVTTGTWVYITGDVVIARKPFQLVMPFRITQASRNNPYGVEIQDFKTIPLSSQTGPNGQG